MTKKRKRTQRKVGRRWGILFVLFVCCFFICIALYQDRDFGKEECGIYENTVSDNVAAQYLWEAHCIDVGQASATLILAGEYAMLVDTGNREDEKLLLEYLSKQGVEKLDYLILTHPHEDHIGSSAKILRELPVERVLMPDISIDICETACYANLLAALEEKEPLIDYPQAGDSYKMGAMNFTVVCPSPEGVVDAEDLNDSSLGIRISDGEHHILIYGDGKQYCEEYMTEYQEITSDILVVGHHGSSYSSSKAFLEAVGPRYAVISCGKDNEYGFPHRAVLRRLEDVGATILRTDELGTIVFVCDGKKITF